MKIEFIKTSERSYAVRILRENFSMLEMNPAPGFDDLMPHDLCHLIVEQAFKIENAIFGQTAKGSGTFRIQPLESSNSKSDSRQRRKAKQKGKDSVKQNQEDYLKSERATYVCWQNWLAHSADSKLKQQAEEMRINAESIFSQMSWAERAVYTKENLVKVRTRMDELSNQWQNLKIGEAMSVDW